MATWTGAWSRPPWIRDTPILIVTGTTAAGEPPVAAWPEPEAGIVATCPTEVTVPGIVVVPSGMVTTTGSPAWTAGPPTVSETETTGVSEVPDSTVAPAAAGAPSGTGVAVTRSGPGRKTTSPSGIAPVTGRPCACCHRPIAASVDQPNTPSAGPGTKPRTARFRWSSRTSGPRVMPGPNGRQAGTAPYSSVTGWPASWKSAWSRRTRRPTAGSQVTIPGPDSLTML